MDTSVYANPERRLTHRETMLIVAGVLVPVFMGSIDQTVLATALPTIGRDLNDMQSLPWLVTTYLIASTAVTPLYGKLADIHGRRSVLMVAILVYMAGSLTCALAPNMATLILGRALHGLGGGGLTSTGVIVLGDIAPPKQRARYYAYFSMAYTTAGAFGPLLGGSIAEHLHWSMIFWFNLPLGIIALILVSTCLGKLPRRERPHKLDVLGAVLIVTSTVSLMLALNLGGVRLAWTSAPILTLGVAAVVICALFVWRLMTAPEPLIPLTLLKNPTARLTVAINTCGWGAIIGLNIFLPMYLQTVMGLSATSAGLSLMMLMFTLNAGAGLGAVVIGRVRHYKTLPTIGLVLTIASVLTLAWHADTMTPLLFQALLFLIGIGFGPIAPLSTVVMQNSVAAHQFGTAVGMMNFSRMLYSTLMVAGFGAIVAGGVTTLAPAQLAPSGFRWVFLAAALSMTVALVAVLRLEEKPLQTEHE